MLSHKKEALQITSSCISVHEPGADWLYQSSSGPGAQGMPVGVGNVLLHGTGEGDQHPIWKLCLAEPLKMHNKRLQFVVATVWAPCLSLWIL